MASARAGGCNIGSRPIDQHLKGFRALGAKVQVENGAVLAHAIDLVGTHIYLDMVSVGATINIMMAATLAEGETIIENPAKEPHVVDVANFLNSMGANVKGAGTDVIRIRGVHKLHGTEYSIIPDQIEAGTFMCAAAITRGDVMVQNVIPKHLEAISAKLIEMGCEVTEFDEAVRVVGRPSHVHTDIKTLPNLFLPRPPGERSWMPHRRRSPRAYSRAVSPPRSCAIPILPQPHSGTKPPDPAR